MKINLNENTEKKIEKICSQFQKETEIELTPEDCIKLSVEALWEEMDNFGIGRMFLRKHLWEKSAVFVSGRDKVIGSQ